MGVAPGGADPIVLVVKKNKSILTNLYKWATELTKERDPNTGEFRVRGVPVLVIDDEADHASVNTKAQGAGRRGDRPVGHQRPHPSVPQHVRPDRLRRLYRDAVREHLHRPRLRPPRRRRGPVPAQLHRQPARAQHVHGSRAGFRSEGGRRRTRSTRWRRSPSFGRSTTTTRGFPTSTSQAIDSAPTCPTACGMRSSSSSWPERCADSAAKSRSTTRCSCTSRGSPRCSDRWPTRSRSTSRTSRTGLRSARAMIRSSPSRSSGCTATTCCRRPRRCGRRRTLKV